MMPNCHRDTNSIDNLKSIIFTSDKLSNNLKIISCDEIKQDKEYNILLNEIENNIIEEVNINIKEYNLSYMELLNFDEPLTSEIILHYNNKQNNLKIKIKYSMTRYNKQDDKTYIITFMYCVINDV